MRPYVSIDIETTGLDPERDQILEIGAVIEDWETPIEELPKFHCYVKHEVITGSAYALSMHPKILRRIATEEGDFRYLTPSEVARDFRTWLEARGIDSEKRHVVPAGKNFASFDRQFLRRLPQWDELIPMTHRCVDPGMLYWNPKTDDSIPNTLTCMKRAGIAGEVAHTALEDALVIVDLVRRYYQ